MTKECNKSPDKKHCWHITNQYSDLKMHIHYICCWCGKTKEEIFEYLGNSSWSYDESKHGPHYRIRVMYNG